MATYIHPSELPKETGGRLPDKPKGFIKRLIDAIKTKPESEDLTKGDKRIYKI